MELQIFLDEAVLGEKVEVLPLSAKTGAGVDTLIERIRQQLTESERIELKLKAITDSLCVHIGSAKKELSTKKEAAIKQREATEKTIERLLRRAEEVDTYCKLYGERIDSIFMQLSSRLKTLIDNHFGFINLLRHRLLGGQSAIKRKLETVVEESKLEEQIEQLISEIASSTLSFRNRLLEDAREDLKLSTGNSEQIDVAIPLTSSSEIDLKELSTRIKDTAESALNRSFLLGGAAAATGVGAQIVSTLALVELSAMIVSLVLAVASYRSVPAEKKKAKRNIDETLKKLGESLGQSLQESIETEIEGALETTKQAVTPRIEELRELESTISSTTEELDEILEKAGKYT